MKTTACTRIIEPGATIGILGGGQLARMTALAAREMGYRIAVLDADSDCAAAAVADYLETGAFDDVEAAARLAARCAVVTYEIERIAPAVLCRVAEAGLLRPAPEVLGRLQNRVRQRAWLGGKGYPVGPWREVRSAAELRAGCMELGTCRVKRAQGGYDGRSQARLLRIEDCADVLELLGSPCIAEQELALAGEYSVLVARSPSGEIAVHPVAENCHRDGILISSLLPARLEPRIEQRIRAIAVSLAEELHLEGVLVVETFLTERGELLVNELAPRPHNTYHAAAACCTTGQFEQYVRAICGLPLGSAEYHGSALLLNLLGPDGPFDTAVAMQVLRIPGVSVHLYGKAPRPRRKLGHVVIRSNRDESLLERATQVMSILGISAPSPTAVA